MWLDNPMVLLIACACYIGGVTLGWLMRLAYDQWRRAAVKRGELMPGFPDGR